jgi:hypothetical protein
MRLYKKGLVIISAVVLLFVVAGATVAFTQDQDPQRLAEDQGTVDQPPWNRVVRRIRQLRTEHRLRQLMTDALAAELELSVEELTAARQAAWAKAIEQARDEGLISKQRADLMLARTALAGYVQMDQLAAGILGISVDELVAAHQEGKTLRQLATELGLDWPTVRDNFQSVREDTIRQAVVESVITEEQAELLLNNPFGWPHPRPRPPAI